MASRQLRSLLLAAGTLSPALVYAQSTGIEGTWRTPTGSAVKAYSCGSEICFKILEIEKSAPYTKDGLNPDPALKTRALCGLEIGTGFHPEDGGAKAENGRVYDPKSGKTYKGSLATDGPDKLKLRGYVGAKLFGRTEEWTRVTTPVEQCKAS